MPRAARAALALSLLATLVAAARSHAAEDASEVLSRSVAALRRLDGEMRDRTLPMLVLLKRIEASEMQPDRVRVLRDQVPVRAANDPKARSVALVRRDQVLVELERRERWIKVRLDDGREGWISDAAVQKAARAATTRGQVAWSPSEQHEVLAIAAGMLREVNARYDTATAVAASGREALVRLEAEGSRAPDTLRRALETTAAHVETMHTYANHFFEVYTAKAGPIAAEHGSRAIDGEVSIATGRTSYSSDFDRSQMAHDLDFSGGMILSERSRLTAKLSHHNELLQTPYGTTDLRIGHHTASASGSRLDSYVAFSTYDDRAVDPINRNLRVGRRNSFGRYGAGLDHERAWGPAGTLSVRLDVDGKNYREDNDNAYQNAHLDLGLLKRRGGGREMELGLDGILQSSDASFLDFKRLQPEMVLRRTTGAGTFALRSELEWIGFSEDANGNDFTREQVEMLWNGAASDRTLSLSAKQFPNSSTQTYLKLAAQTGWRSTAAAKSARTSLSLISAYFPSGGDAQSAYADLRADRSTTNGPRTLDASVFARVWADADPDLQRDHTLDLDSRYTWAFSNLRLGPVAGAHLALAPGMKAVKRDGNSWRVGFDFGGNYTIKNTPVQFGLRYERGVNYVKRILLDPNGNPVVDPVTGEVTFGGLASIQPSSNQLTGGAVVPLRDALQLKIDLSRYSVDLDRDATNSTNPADSKRSQLSLNVELGYRFGL